MRRAAPRRTAFLTSLVLLIALVALAIVSIGIGRYAVTPQTVLRILAAMLTANGTATTGGTHWTEAQWVIVEFVRLPRVLLATICGMGLALSGAVLQGLFRNPLVGPEIVGVSHGAAFGGVAAILLYFSPVGIVAAAFVCGLGALFLAFSLSRLAGNSSVLSMVLSGVIVSAFFSAAVGMGEYVADSETQLPTIIYWLLGSFAGADTDKVVIAAAPIAVAGTLLFLLRWRINLLALGEADAQVLGVNVGLLRWSLASLVALIVAAQVSVSGGIGWIGLIVPHFGRMLVGPDHRALLPVSALLGGLYLLAMDNIARTATAQEIPIGILTALIGAPFFAIVFWKLQSRGWSRE